MNASYVLIGAVAAVGILHTIVPDHWLPITILARQQGWTRRRVVRAATIAGGGHTISTLFIAVLVWGLGAAIAVNFGNVLTLLSGIAMILLGGWIAVASLREMAHTQWSSFGHVLLLRHADGTEHRHYHAHSSADWHRVSGNLALAPAHDHAHPTSAATALALILGSSPMVEGIPAFFAAARYGVGQLAIMAAIFAASTIATYIAMCLLGTAGLQRATLGRFERYGEVLSGVLIALIGVIFLVR